MNSTKPHLSNSKIDKLIPLKKKKSHELTFSAWEVLFLAENQPQYPLSRFQSRTPYWDWFSHPNLQSSGLQFLRGKFHQVSYQLQQPNKFSGNHLVWKIRLAFPPACRVSGQNLKGMNIRGRKSCNESQLLPNSPPTLPPGQKFQVTQLETSQPLD